jgi:hypothetical protein
MQTEPNRCAVSKVKQFLKEYGLPGVAVHFSLYFFTWAALYLGINNGLINVSDVQRWLKKLKLDKYGYGKYRKQEKSNKCCISLDFNQVNTTAAYRDHNMASTPR